MRRGIFITGTDTGAGKTVITGLLARYLAEKGYKVITQKWIQTGSRGYPEDIRVHLKIMQRNPREIGGYLELVSPYRFKFASSPHLASRIEGKKINPAKIIRSFRKLSREFDYVLVEGIGGALVPFNNKRLVIDIVRKLNLPVLVAAQNKLGAINHTLLTVEALLGRGLRISGIVFNHKKGENQKILKDNRLIIGRLTGQDILGNIVWNPDYKKLYKDFIPIARRIIQKLKDD